jgi:transcriptional regulator with XRE-family HTH domain
MPKSENSILTSSLDVRRFPLKMDVDFTLLAIEIIRALRGKVSQRELSQLLGYSFNQVGKWENGSTQIKYVDFFRICLLLNVPLEHAFRQTFSTLPSNFDLHSTLVAIDKEINPLFLHDRKYQAKVKSWISNKTSPDFSEILKLIGQQSNILLAWLSHLLPMEKITLLKEHYKNFMSLAEILSDPLVVYINAALHLHDYQKMTEHSDLYISKHAACTVEEVKETLKRLTAKRIITYKNHKYYPYPQHFNVAGLKNFKYRGLTYQTSLLAARRYPSLHAKLDRSAVKTPGISTVRVTAVSVKAAEKVQHLISQFVNEVTEILRQDTDPKDNVQAFILHFFPSNINSDGDQFSISQNAVKPYKIDKN